MQSILGQDTLKQTLNTALGQGMAVLLVGPTGCGKTSVVQELAEAQGKTMTRFNMTGETAVDDFVGKMALVRDGTAPVTKWQDGVLLQAMRLGHWLLTDEINMMLPEVGAVLHPVIDHDRTLTVVQNDGEVVVAHPDFRLIGTMNPPEEYAGTKDLNKALLSRFGAVLHMTYPSADIEQQILVRDGLKLSHARKMTAVAQEIRKLKADGQVFYSLSTRDLRQWGQLVEPLGLQRSFETSVLAKAGHIDAELLRKAYTAAVGSWDEVSKIEDELGGPRQIAQRLRTFQQDLASLEVNQLQVEADRKSLHELEVELAKREDELKRKQERVALEIAKAKRSIKRTAKAQLKAELKAAIDGALSLRDSAKKLR